MKLSTRSIAEFRELVWDYYRQDGRSMPWRTNPSPYCVLVSEIMLQQTQVSRVIPKFNEFVVLFPDFAALADAPLAQVLAAWAGLGYNRRARFLHEAAKQIVATHGGMLPDNPLALQKLPGVGQNTAGAVLAYAFNQPAAFVETNIRTVYLHHFFPDQQEVSDKAILDLVEQTLDKSSPREWYWALMDYGSELKVTEGGRLDQSRHYKKQPAFAGSLRQMRGMIIQRLLAGPAEATTLERHFADERVEPALEGLLRDGLIERQNGIVSLTGAGVAPHNE